MGHLHNIIGLEERTERDTLVIAQTLRRGWSLQWGRDVSAGSQVVGSWGLKCMA